MSWGAWGGGISMIFFAAIESLMNKEWSYLLKTRDSKTAEFARNIMIGILPIGLWFAWWASHQAATSLDLLMELGENGIMGSVCMNKVGI